MAIRVRIIDVISFVVPVLSSVGCYYFVSSSDTPLSGPHTAIAIVVGVGSLIGLIYALFNCSCCDESSLLKYEETPDDDAVQVEAEDDFSPPTESTPNEQKSSATSQEAVSNITSPSGTGVDSTALEPYDDPKLQFSRDQLNYVEEMGSGWFGKVLRGEAHQIHPGMRKTRVVVKQLRDSATPDEQVMFAKEVQPYREVNHPNVMMLLGQCLETSPLLLIMEYAPNGDLKAFLRKNKDKTQSFAQDDVQLKMATDVISGLLWLHQADFVHIDLAARNCQVCTDNVIKIGDYGTSLEKYPNDYHMTKDGRHAVPIRWLAPEVINADSDNIEPKKITKQSNIWSFGVIMLELSTGGDSPYPALSDEEVLQKIVRERQIQLDKPNLAMKYADRWCETMMFCWLDEDNRPTTKEVHDLIQHLKTYKEQLNKDDFNARWDALKPAAVREASSESSIEVPSPQRKVDDGKFESSFVEAEISVTPEEHQMQENPNSQFIDDFAPRGEEQTPQKVERGNPFLKDLAEQFAGEMEGKSETGEPLETSTPMTSTVNSPAVQSMDRSHPSDTSGSYITATGSLLEPEDTDTNDTDTFNTLVESMMEDTIASITAGKDDKVEEADDTIPTKEDENKDVNQNQGGDLFHSEAGIAIAEPPVAPTQQVTEESPKEDEFHGYAQVERKAAPGPKKLTITVSSGQKSKTLEIENSPPKDDTEIPSAGQGTVILKTDTEKDEVEIISAQDEDKEEEEEPKLEQTGAGGDIPSLTFTISGKQQEKDEEKEEEEKAKEDGDEGSSGLPGFQINVEIPKEQVEEEPHPPAVEPQTNGHPAGDASPGIERDDDNKDCKRGKLDFSVQYNEKKMDLRCSIHRAHDLKAMDPNGFSDPYVKLHILPRASSRSTKLRTKTKFKTLNPEFKEELEYHGITPSDLHAKTLRLSVWDEDSLGHNDFIGEYLLPLSKLPLNEAKSYSVFLQDQSDEIDDMSEAERGKILLGLQYFRKQGQLRVTIVRCAGLYAMDSNGYSDPYVKLYLQPDPKKKTKQKTATKKKTLNPEYNETFLYSLPPADIQAKTLEVTVWDKDVGTNDYIGGVQLGYLAKGDRRQHWIDAIDNPDQLVERWHILSETQFSEDD